MPDHSFATPESHEQLSHPKEGSGKQGLLNYIVSPVFVALLGIAGVLVAIGFWSAAGDPLGEHTWLFLLALGAPALPTVWAVLRTLWSKEPNVGISIISTVVAGVLSSAVLAVVAMATVLMPSVSAAIVESRIPPHGTHYFFGVDEGHPVVAALTYMGIMGSIIAILAGLVAVMLVVLPVTAMRGSRAMNRAAEHMHISQAEHGLAAAGQAFSALIILVFLIPTMIIVGVRNTDGQSLSQAVANSWKFFTSPQEYWASAVWTFGILLIPLAVWLLVFTAVRTRAYTAEQQARIANSAKHQGEGPENI